MFNYFKSHPFKVKTDFNKSIVLTYAVPKNDLENLIPECLELDTYENNWAFIAVAFVDTKQLRPSGFPKWLGNDFILAGYRIFVRYKNTKGKRLRGLYILKSETNKSKMAFLGNIFTNYNYSKTDIKIEDLKDIFHINSTQSKINIELFKKTSDIQLPIQSPFNNFKEARRFAGPLPFTFTYNNSKKEVLIIQGTRSNWKPLPLEVKSHSIDYINTNYKNAILANAFFVENIPYQWKKGIKEIWNK